jgi:alpha-tubulin suppressor-like RCC1 family protein
MRAALAFLFLLLAAYSAPALAQCTNPTASAGGVDHIEGGVYSICDGTMWQVLSIDNINAGSCAKTAALEYDTSTDKYRICNGAYYRPVNCVTGGTAPTATVTTKGTANNKTAMSSWTALSSLSLNAGDTLLVCASSKDPLSESYWKEISSGNNYNCAIRADDALYCWGTNGTGQLGDNSLQQRSAPTPVNGGGSWKAIAAGRHTCGIKTDDTLWCWGSNNTGQLGDNSTTQRLVPTQVSGGGSWLDVSTGESHSCGIKTDFTLWCWGFNVRGELGDNSTTQRLVPTQVSGGGSWVDVSAGSAYTCGIQSGGTMYCWGAGSSGQLGDNSTTDRLTPTAVSGGNFWVFVSAGGEHACGITSFFNLYCWGRNLSGRTGLNTYTGNTLVPTEVSGGGSWSWVDTGVLAQGSYAHSCGIKSDSTLWCWGSNNIGQLGDNTTTERLVPTQTITARTWWRASTGGDHSCALVENTGQIYCWGWNNFGQFGNGSTSDNMIPQSVRSGVIWGGYALDQFAYAPSASNGATYIYSLSNAPSGTNDIIVTFDVQTTTGKAITAMAVSNLATTAAFDRSASATGSGTAPSSGTTSTTSQADDFLFGCIGTNGPIGDTAGTWSGSFTNDQRDGSTGGSATTNMTANSGYRQVAATGTYSAAKTGAQNRDWQAAIAAFKVALPCATYGTCSSEAQRNYVASNGIRWCDGANWLQMKAP